MTRDDRSIEELATAWLSAERGVEADPNSDWNESTAQGLAARYEDAVRRASVEELRLAWEAAQAGQRDCLVGTAEWGEARRVAVLLRGEYLARRG